MSGPVLSTERLMLTPVVSDDFGDILTLWQDVEFTRHITGRALSHEEVWFRVLRDIGHWSAVGHGNWTIRDKETGDYVGSVGILDFRRDLAPPFDAPELGWGIGPAFQGRGMAHEALSAALDWADTVLAAPRTVCMISAENAASIALATRTGYAPYAIGRYKDEPVTLFRRLRP